MHYFFNFGKLDTKYITLLRKFFRIWWAIMSNLLFKKSLWKCLHSRMWNDVENLSWYVGKSRYAIYHMPKHLHPWDVDNCGSSFWKQLKTSQSIYWILRTGSCSILNLILPWFFWSWVLWQWHRSVV